MVLYPRYDKNGKCIRLIALYLTGYITKAGPMYMEVHYTPSGGIADVVINNLDDTIETP